MEIKTCKICGLEKYVDEFYFRKDTNKYRTECKDCLKKQRKEYYEINKIRLCEQKRKYEKLNRDVILAKRKKKYIENRDKLLLQKKEYYQKNKDKIKEKAKQYRNKNKEKIRISGLEYRKKHRKELSERSTKYCLYREKNDSLYYFKKRIRQNIRTSFIKKGFFKSSKTEEIIGCKLEELINWLINTYEKNYSEKWDWNYINKVHIDHIRPLKLCKTKEEVIKFCHYTNLQLLKAEDNMAKGSKY